LNKLSKGMDMNTIQREQLANCRDKIFPRLYQVKTEALRKTKEFFGR